MDRINGARTVDIGSGRRGFRQKDAAAGIKGTELAALWHNAIQEEVLHCIEAAELVPDESDWTQLFQAIGILIANATPSLAGYLLKSGDVMSGLLTLSGAPTANLHAATKAYVDLMGLGVNQSWKAVTRSAGVVYHNVTGGPIAVSVENSSNGSGTVLVGPVNPPTISAYSSGGDTTPGTGGTVIIPKDAYYKTTGVIYIFAELTP